MAEIWTVDSRPYGMNHMYSDINVIRLGVAYRIALRTNQYEAMMIKFLCSEEQRITEEARTEHIN